MFMPKPSSLTPKVEDGLSDHPSEEEAAGAEVDDGAGTLIVR